jgi:hypothetical protein
MIQSHEAAIVDLTVISLHGAIRWIAVGLLEGTHELDVTTIRRVERLMGVVLELACVGNGMPLMEFHSVATAWRDFRLADRG